MLHTIRLNSALFRLHSAGKTHIIVLNICPQQQWTNNIIYLLSLYSNYKATTVVLIASNQIL